ncbi:hypothetical protein G4G27_04435 [Sphingomonas sp. So64.6b]|uniref:EF-hand domain-containing protein n=1 Tax=Sphingomonas sp. So64.6b TaxID=2997354 RepID=UPI001602642F|nr:EF-hand domain-containing protein [Sphingomonas sp. So64.6b]QNA83334.1 hypothetical protein G4G27_04435 [Sphingomonas sp. So64.6b]
MKKLLLAAALATTALAGGAAIAGQAEPGQRGGGMMRADTDNDGAVSRAEARAQAEARFARMDTNNDGQLAGDELKHRGRRGTTDGDATPITREAFLAKADERFAKLDTNNDGRISADEMAAARAGRGDRPGRGDMVRPAPTASPTDGPARGHGGIAKADTNGDGRISRDEMRAQEDRRFAKLDTNGDGFIDQAEMDASRAKMKAMRDQRRGGQPGGPGDMPPPSGADAPEPDTGQ